MRKVKPPLNLDSLKDLKTAELSDSPCETVLGGKLLAIKFALDKDGRHVACYKSVQESGIVQEMKTLVFKEQALLAGAHRVKEAAIYMKICLSAPRIFYKSIAVTEHSIKTQIKDPEIMNAVKDALKGWGFISDSKDVKDGNDK